MSKEASGGNITMLTGLRTYWLLDIIELVTWIKGCEVMAVQSFASFQIHFLWCINGAAADFAQTPTHEKFDIPDSASKSYSNCTKSYQFQL